MKEITFVVPCYNSQDYMHRCIDSLLPAGDACEIIIVNDGSSDGTAAIADEYKTKYPDIVEVIHKENGGHGSGVNAGLEKASGYYFKVVDSDDWLDKDALPLLMKDVHRMCEDIEAGFEDLSADLIVCNYIYDHLDIGEKKYMRYRNVFRDKKMCTWNTIRHFRPSQYLVMHSLFFRTSVLRKSKVRLPEHTFYVDNLFSNKPLPYVKRIWYRDLDMYHYYLGRDDQSVNESVLMKRIDQQIKVTKMVATCTNLRKVQRVYPGLAKYLKRNTSIMMSISCIHLLLIGDEEALEKRDKLWNYIKEYDIFLYRWLRYRTLCGFTYLPGKLGDKLTIAGYRLAGKIYKFN
ncbi:MAG: glycosyltransferase family 2 protein [Lachnospiraceae bacterium]|nr:glycosyltransferase family 2 protein [Lachnospiraceae bacterium]